MRNIMPRKRNRKGSVVVKLAVAGFMLYLVGHNSGTAHADELSPMQRGCEHSVATAITLGQDGMTINPCVELDTSQVVDSRFDIPDSTLLAPIGDGDVTYRTWNQLIVMGYAGDPDDGSDDVLYVVPGVAGALERIGAGVNR